MPFLLVDTLEVTGDVDIFSVAHHHAYVSSAEQHSSRGSRYSTSSFLKLILHVVLPGAWHCILPPNAREYQHPETPYFFVPHVGV